MIVNETRVWKVFREALLTCAGEVCALQSETWAHERLPWEIVME